jgi:two-component system sensor histidine kinase BaeS
MADISHELRTPLAVLRAEIEAIQDGVRPCDGERIGSLHRSVLGMSHLVNDLYELALSDVGALTYHKTAVDLGALLEAALDDCAGACADTGLTLERAIGEGLRVFADPGRLRQVIDNLLSNARRYTDAGGSVLVRAQRAGDWVALDVLDSAPGVDAERLERLFDRFYRVEESRNRARGGAGLVLAICRTIVQAHGGRISASPSPRGGVWVAVRLPAGTPDLSGHLGNMSWREDG